MEKKKTSTKKSNIKVNPRVSDCYEETQGFTGSATSHKGVVIRKGKGGFEAPRFGLDNYRSLGAIKSAIDKLMKEKEGETVRDAEGNQTQNESFESSTGEGYYSERYKQIVEGAKERFFEVAPPGKKYERMVKHIKKNYPEDKEGIAYATAWKMKNAEKAKTESYVPGKPAEKLGAVTAIPKDEQDAAKARLLAKTKAIRDKKKIREEIEIEEGMTLKDFKANRKKNERKAATADARKRGHEGSEWHNTGRTYSTGEAQSRRANMSDDDRAARKRAAIDPDDDRDENTYSADKTKNPKKLRKQKAMGEEHQLSELNRYEKETGKSTGPSSGRTGLNTPKAGTPIQKGGTQDKAVQHVKKMMRSMSGGKEVGQRKKEKGKKPPTAGQWGAPQSPAQKVAARRAAAKKAKDNMSSRYD